MANIDWHRCRTCCSKWAIRAQSRLYFSSCAGVLEQLPWWDSIRGRSLSDQVWCLKIIPIATGARRSSKTMMIINELIKVNTDGLIADMALEVHRVVLDLLSPSVNGVVVTGNSKKCSRRSPMEHRYAPTQVNYSLAKELDAIWSAFVSIRLSATFLNVDAISSTERIVQGFVYVKFNFIRSIKEEWGKNEKWKIAIRQIKKKFDQLRALCTDQPLPSIEDTYEWHLDMMWHKMVWCSMGHN